MALHYQTEYRLGNRGRVVRSYTGFQAFVAIAIDLVFGLLFELIFAGVALAMRIVVLVLHLVNRLLHLYWRFLTAVMTLVVYAVTLPFAWINQAVARLRPRPDRDASGDHWAPGSTKKPNWAYGREL